MTATLTKPKLRRTVTSAQPRRKRKTVLLDGISLDAVLHARSPKKKVNEHFRSPPKPLKTKGVCQTDTLSLKSQGKPNQSKSGSIDFSDLGVFTSRSTAEDVVIIRSWMAARGLPEIDPLFAITEFASVLERYVRPRHAWTHFAEREEPRARRFLAAQAAALLPELLSASTSFSENSEKPGARRQPIENKDKADQKSPKKGRSARAVNSEILSAGAPQ